MIPVEIILNLRDISFKGLNQHNFIHRSADWMDVGVYINNITELRTHHIKISYNWIQLTISQFINENPRLLLRIHPLELFPHIEYLKWLLHVRISIAFRVNGEDLESNYVKGMLYYKFKSHQIRRIERARVCRCCCNFMQQYPSDCGTRFDDILL